MGPTPSLTAWPRLLAGRPDAALTIRTRRPHRLVSPTRHAAVKQPSLRAWAGCVLVILPTLAACQSSGEPPPMPRTRDRNYMCQVLAPGETIEDEALCEENKHWMSPEPR